MAKSWSEMIMAEEERKDAILSPTNIEQMVFRKP
jgi:hypothetical protein